MFESHSLYNRLTVFYINITMQCNHGTAHCFTFCKKHLSDHATLYVSCCQVRVFIICVCESVKVQYLVIH